MIWLNLFFFRFGRRRAEFVLDFHARGAGVGEAVGPCLGWVAWSCGCARSRKCHKLSCLSRGFRDEDSARSNSTFFIVARVYFHGSF